MTSLATTASGLAKPGLSTVTADRKKCGLEMSDSESDSEPASDEVPKQEVKKRSQCLTLASSSKCLEMSGVLNAVEVGNRGENTLQRGNRCGREDEEVMDTVGQANCISPTNGNKQSQQKESSDLNKLLPHAADQEDLSNSAPTSSSSTAPSPVCTAKLDFKSKSVSPLMALFHRHRTPTTSSKLIDERKCSSTGRKRKLPDWGGEHPKQLILDAGQKRFGHEHCTECGMVYSVSTPSDLEAHEQHHRRHDLLHWATLNSKVAKSWTTKLQSVRDFATGSVYKLTADSPRLATSVLEAIVVDYVNQELGCSEQLWESHKGLKQENRAAYVYLKTDERASKIAGVAVVEPIAKAACVSDKRIVDGKDLIGVNRIWVHRAYRKLGIATKLLDCVRSDFFYGVAAPRRNFAFSDPTEAGRAFAYQFLGGGENAQLLLYRIGEDNC